MIMLKLLFKKFFRIFQTLHRFWVLLFTNQLFKQWFYKQTAPSCVHLKKLYDICTFTQKNNKKIYVDTTQLLFFCYFQLLKIFVLLSFLYINCIRTFERSMIECTYLNKKKTSAYGLKISVHSKLETFAVNCLIFCLLTNS